MQKSTSFKLTPNICKNLPKEIFNRELPFLRTYLAWDRSQFCWHLKVFFSLATLFLKFWKTLKSCVTDKIGFLKRTKNSQPILAQTNSYQMPYFIARTTDTQYYTLDLFAPDLFKIMLSKGVSLWKLWNRGY